MGKLTCIKSALDVYPVPKDSDESVITRPRIFIIAYIYSPESFNMIFKISSILAALVLAACSSASDADKVSLDDARAQHEAGQVTLIDIREPQEHRTGVAAGALLLPMSELAQKQTLIPKNSEKPVLLICNTQNRSKATLAALKEQGYQNIRYVEGGMSQWAAKGWPLSRPQP